MANCSARSGWLANGDILIFSQPAKSDQTGLTDFPQTAQTSSSSDLVEETSTEVSEESSQLVVDVKGAVAKPGLYTLAADAC